MREHDVTAGSPLVRAGTLCLPENASIDTPVPAVLLIAGSGADTRDGDLRMPTGSAPAPGTLRHIAYDLADHGVATLRWDRRGFGAAGGDPDGADYNTDLEDATAWFQWLRSRPEVASDRVAVAGHSAGALTACRVCRDVPGVAGAMFLGALASPIEDMLRWNVERMKRAWGSFSDEQRAWLATELPGRLARSENFEVVLDAARGGEPSVRVEGYGVSLEIRTARLRQDLATSYPDEFRPLACPALVLHGGHDMNVPVDDALVAYRVLRDAGNDDVQLTILPGLEHYFVPVSPDPVRRAWERLSLEALRQRPMSCAALHVISRWAVRTL